MIKPIRVTEVFKAAARGKFCLLILGFTALVPVAPAQADWLDSIPRFASAQAEGGWHKGPRGYHSMCARDPKLCMYDYQARQDQGVSAPKRLDQPQWNELDRLNREMNRAIRPRTDPGPDHWTLGVYSGDCEDYAIAKKHALIEADWSADQLLYAVVEGISSPYHLVLVVRTDRGDFVLDNLTDRITSWEDSGYTFVIRQSAEDPTQWAYVPGSGQRTGTLGTAGVGTQ